MIEQDTIRLLRECDAGAKMGVSSLGDAAELVRDPGLAKLLENSRKAHESIGGQIRAQLDRFQDEGKDPPLLASAMSELMTRLKVAIGGSDAVIADQMTDGCNMGVKSLSKYLNQYAAADEAAKDAAKRLIRLEEQLSTDLRAYL